MRFQSLVAACAACVLASAATADFSGPYEAQLWQTTGILDGITTISPESGLTDALTFGYDVDLGNPGPGVSFRTSTFSIEADKSGTISFDYDYSGFHAFSSTRVYLEVFAETSDGVTSIVLVDQPDGAGFQYTGSVQIDVEAGMGFGIIVGGGNFDSNSVIHGEVELTNFSRPLSLDGAYAMDHWSTTGIIDGTTEISPESGDATVGTFEYDVDLGNPGPGVPFRTAEFGAIAGGTGPVSFDYLYEGFHAFFEARVYLEVFAETSTGRRSIVLVDELDGGGHSYEGSALIDVEKGMPFGIIVGGGNGDSNSVINGRVDVSRFSGPRAFDGALRLENWTNTGIDDGTTATSPTSGPADRPEFSYEVDLGNPGPGVTFRTTEWAVESDHTGLASFDWSHTGNHSFFDANVYLEAFAETASGRETIVLVDEASGPGFLFEGRVELRVEAGMPFGIVAGGGNLDRISLVSGTVTLSEICVMPCPADFDRDGDLTLFDFLAFQNAFDAGDPSADFDGDGDFTLFDFLAFQNAFDTGC
ncbi:MAG: GC-type dockerin domain-anchored protein [Phycisphaerales bacterium JB064]